MTARTINIGGRPIGKHATPFVIAEMSGNHNQSLERALKIVDAAAEAGAHALKLQTYTADTITLDSHRSEFKINDETSLWSGKNLHDLYSAAYTPREWHQPIMERARALGLICFSSPFDETAVDFLETLNVPAYKIASFENNHLPLIRKAASTGKPLIISAGMATLSDLDDAIRVARDTGCTELVFLKCTSTYPATPDNSNILTIPHMRELFGCEIGLSDHTMGIGVAVAAVAHGATVIEKHLTLSRADGGVDSAFSIEPAELRQLVTETERAWRALGHISYGATQSEEKSLIFRRSIYVVEDIEAGDAITDKNVRVIRPGLGLEPRYYDCLLGMRAINRINRGTPLSWDLLK